MSAKTISITVEAEAARSFSETSPEERRKIERLLATQFVNLRFIGDPTA